MPWLGVWFDATAGDGGPRDPQRFRGLAAPIVYPFAHSFIEAEARRLAASRDPARIARDGETFNVYYSLDHNGTQTGLDQQGCRILHWLFQHFETGSQSAISARFSEIPVVIHCDEPAKAAAMGNALTLLRFLSASEDQAIARILLHPWNPFRGSVALAAADYEKRVIDFLHDEIFYPEGITVFDVLERNDLRAHRALGTCCLTQIGFIGPLLEWIDECWPQTDTERRDLQEKIRNSLADEAKYLRASIRRSKRSQGPPVA